MITNELHKVLIFVVDPAAILADYDSIIVFKSVTGPSGAFQAMLSSLARAAELIGTKKEGFSLNGKELRFTADGGVESSVFFTTEVSAADVAAKIVSATGLLANDQGGYVRIRSGTSGLTSTMQVETSSDGGVELGFYKGVWDVGEGQWLSLSPTQKLYILDDPHSSDDYWYKYIFINSSTGSYSVPSAPFMARPVGALDPTNIIYGTGVIVDLEGNPVEGKRIVVYNRFVPKVVSGALIDGPQTKIYETDEQGLVAIPFVHGSKVSIGIEDTKLRRDIDVPDSGDAFNLLDESLLDDRLGIEYYPIVDGERTTL